MKYLRLLAIALAWLLVVACGDTTIAAPVTEPLRFTGTIPADGFLAIPLPPERADFPNFTCFVSGDGQNWFRVDAWPGVSGVALCFLTRQSSGAAITLANATPGWRYVVTVE